MLNQRRVLRAISHEINSGKISRHVIILYYSDIYMNSYMRSDIFSRYVDVSPGKSSGIYTHTCLCVCVFRQFNIFYYSETFYSVPSDEVRSPVGLHTFAHSLISWIWCHFMSFHFIHSLMHSFIHSVIHSLTCSLIQSFVHSFSHFIRSCIPLRQLVQSCNPLIFWSPLLLKRNWHAPARP